MILIYIICLFDHLPANATLHTPLRFFHESRLIYVTLKLNLPVPKIGIHTGILFAALPAVGTCGLFLLQTGISQKVDKTASAHQVSIGTLVGQKQDADGSIRRSEESDKLSCDVVKQEET